MYKLEKAIKELHSLFVEMANLVDEQGEMVNRILDNVTNTEAYVEKAVEDVHQAARYQSSRVGHSWSRWYTDGTK